MAPPCSLIFPELCYQEAPLEDMSLTTQLCIGQKRSMVNLKVKCHHHVRHVGQLHIIVHAQCYKFLPILCTMKY